MLGFQAISEVEMLSAVVITVKAVEVVCDCTEEFVVLGAGGTPEVAVKLTIVSEMAGVVSLLS